MANLKDNERLYDFQGTGVGTSSGVTVTQTASGTEIFAVTNIECSGDAAAVVTVESPSGTAIWKKRFAAAFVMSENFQTPKYGAAGAAVLVKVSASTSNCEANIGGFATLNK